MLKASKVVEQLRATLSPLAVRYQMAPLRAPSELLHAMGCWGQAPVRIDTEISLGEGFLSRLQVAVVRSEDDAMAGLTAVAVPSPDLASPIFGCDLVAFRGRFVLCALDLSGGELSDEDAARLTIARQRLATCANPRNVPDFARSCFSEHASVVSEADRPLDEALPQAFDAFLACFEHRLARSALRPWAVGEAEQARYFAAMRSNKRESKAMAKLFGAAWAERYFSELFFADAVVASRAA